MGREDGREARGEAAFSTLSCTWEASQPREPFGQARGSSCGHRSRRTAGVERCRQRLRFERLSAHDGIRTGGGSPNSAPLQRQLRTLQTASCTKPRARPLRRTPPRSPIPSPTRGGAARLGPSRCPPRKAAELRSAQPGPSRRDAAAPRSGGGRPGGRGGGGGGGGGGAAGAGGSRAAFLRRPPAAEAAPAERAHREPRGPPEGILRVPGTARPGPPRLRPVRPALLSRLAFSPPRSPAPSSRRSARSAPS